MDDNVVSLRMARENCNGGELHASLIWNDIADLDLHVITPSKEHLYFGHRESRCGGWLDIDMNASSISLEPIENIFWASSPSGHYKIYVHNYNNRTDTKTVFTDSTRKVPFRVRLIRDNKTEWFDGSAGSDENVTCFEFDHVGSGAIGSYVVLPPSDTKTTFKELCEKNNVTYTAGNGYYALCKSEKVSTKKDMILHDIKKDTFIIGSDQCKDELKLEKNVDLRIKKKDVPEKYRLFIQSTSHNRVIPKDIHSLMKVSIKEALTHRCSDKYTFNS